MDWKLREREIAFLKMKHGSDRSLVNQLPDYSQHHNNMCSNNFSKIVDKKKEVIETGLTVSHLHKSSYQVLLPSEVQYASKKV